MADIDRLSRRVPNLCKVAPATAAYHMEDVHRAGGVVGILGELDRAGLLDTSVPTVHSPTLKDALARWDIAASSEPAAQRLFGAAPGGVPTQVAFSQDRTWDVDADRAKGCIRSLEHAYSRDGGLAVLYGNLAEAGCIVKTAGVDESNLRFAGPGCRSRCGRRPAPARSDRRPPLPATRGQWTGRTYRPRSGRR